MNDIKLCFNEKCLNIPYNKIYSVHELKKLIILEINGINLCFLFFSIFHKKYRYK